MVYDHTAQLVRLRDKPPVDMRARDKGLTVIVGLALVALPQLAHAQQSCASPVAVFESVKNTVQLLQASTRAAIPAARQVQVCAGDTIEVGDNSRAVLLMIRSNTPLVIDQNSEFVVTDAPTGGGSFVNLVKGALLFITRVKRSIEIRTPFVNAAIEGTEFVVRVLADRTVITVYEGTVRATTIKPEATLLVGAGQQAVAIQGQAPQLQVIVRPRDAVQWALYYEPVLPSDSFAQLGTIPQASRDVTLYIRRASLLLGAGQLDEARADLDRAQNLDPSNGNVYALRAVVSVAVNDKQGALDSGHMAVERAPQSSAARLALSYALQSNFDLEAARDVVAQAVEVQPNDAAAWARLAELRLMLDDVGGAVDAARRSVMLSPQLARGHTVLGFTLLAQLDPSEARAAFQRAIDIEPDNPWARLGLGLTAIRQGRLSEGRGDLELAMALNPDSSLIRSYLGKAYFEEKREPLPAEQFDLAKQLDPRDPTAWFYDAIRKETLNRPVEALADLQSSIERNNNRAVYRSRLRLDEDLAARGTELSRIYSDLGFEELALVEGWKSLDVDPANHAAHRLLADNYLALPSHQIAKDSELLQSQLTQPVNINPVQPRLADNGLNFLDDIGISGVGLNEFTRLFAANGVRVIADGMVGTQNTITDNVIASGLFNRISFSVGHFHFKSDGVRENNDVSQNIFNIFSQVDLTHATSVQIEVRDTDSEQGDRTLLFDPLFIRSNLRSVGDVTSVRLGFRQQFTPSAVLIGSYARRTLTSDFTAGDLRVLNDDHADFVELRHLQRWNRANVTAGFGYFNSDGVQTQTFRSMSFPSQPLDTRHANGYIYATINLLPEVAVSAGLSGDSLTDSLIGERKQANPKLGISWLATSRTWVRGAAFRTLDRTLVSGQTIEPTQVMGFNQFFFDDGVGSGSWHYGVAVDQGVWVNGYAGVEYSVRELTVPAFSPATGSLIEGNIREGFARAYLYSTLTSKFALSAEYQMSRFTDPEGNNPFLLQESTTHKLPLQVRFFDRSGLFARLRATLFKQEGVFRNKDFVLFSGNSQFWITDLSAGWRLPKRWGIASVDIRNLFDRHFRFQDTNPSDATVIPSRQILGRLSFTF